MDLCTQAITQACLLTRMPCMNARLHAHIQPVIKNVIIFYSRDLNFWFPSPLARGGGAAQKIDRKKKAVDPKNLSLWEHIGVDIWPFCV